MNNDEAVLFGEVTGEEIAGHIVDDDDDDDSNPTAGGVELVVVEGQPRPKIKRKKKER